MKALERRQALLELLCERRYEKMANLAIIEKVNRYNKAMENAPAKMLALYLSLYVYNNSQAVIAEDWHLTRESIKNQNRLLQEYLQSSL